MKQYSQKFIRSEKSTPKITRDEATRAMELARKKFMEKDIHGAKKFALKAQNLYPGLEGILQMLVTLDVYISAENKIGGECDWYGILGANPKADDETVRRQYRKLALTLHPDKNKSIGSEGAFKIISEAWSLLSDKSRRTAYDKIRNGISSVKNTPSPTGGSNGFENPPKAQSHTPSAGPSVKQKGHTFWTVCHQCKMQYEYLRMYVNHNLLCPNCHESFLAIETDAPSAKPFNWNFSEQRQNLNRQANSKKVQIPRASWSTFSRTACGSSSATLVQQAYVKVKREREEAQADKKRKEALTRKSYVSRRLGISNAANKRKCMEDAGRDPKTQFGDDGIKMSSSTRELSQFEIRKMLMLKGRAAIQTKLNEWKFQSTAKAEKGTVLANNGDACLQSEHSSKKCDTKMMESMIISVPDSDFCDFDKNRTETSFEENQVWAAYDNDDGMPRFYAMIRNVISLNPFKIKISWLNSNTNSELGPLDWVGSGFSKSCGSFRVGWREFNTSLDSFSHKVRWLKGTGGSIHVYPRKSDVWALYRYWSPDWNEFTADEVIHKYNMVEVLEDYDELGVTVIPLIKVAGFKAVFHRHLDPREIRRIPRKDIFQFSHYVPSYLLTGYEAPNAPKGCRELDPAATPLQLLQVIPDVKEEAILEYTETILENCESFQVIPDVKEK